MQKIISEIYIADLISDSLKNLYLYSFTIEALPICEGKLLESIFALSYASFKEFQNYILFESSWDS